jgi:hypothetical protein
MRLLRTLLAALAFSLILPALSHAESDLLLTRSPPQYAWANRPTCSTVGDRIFITDVGIGGSGWNCDGTEWHPGAVIILGRSAVAITDTTGSTEFNMASVTVPAGVLGTNGGFEVEALYSFTGSTNSKSLIVRHSTSAGAVTGTLLINSSTPSAANILFRAKQVLHLRNAANSEVGPSSALSIALGFGTTAQLTPTVNTANASFINFNAAKATAGETMTLEFYEVRLLP